MTATDTDRLHTVFPDDLPTGRVRAGRILMWLASAVLVGTFVFQALHASGVAAPGFATWRPVVYAYLAWGIALVHRSGPDPRRTGQADPLRAAGGAVHRRHGDLSPALRPLDRLLRLEPQRRHGSAVQRPRQPAPDVGRSVLLERAPQHGLVRPGDPRGIRHRLRPRDAAERRHPGAQVLARGVPDAADALAGGGELDGRQVHARGPLRPGGELRAMARLGQPVVSSARPRSRGPRS